MAYAALTKGTMTLQAAVLMTAMRLGVFEELGREFEKSQPEAWARMRVLPLPAGGLRAPDQSRCPDGVTAVGVG